MQDIIVTPTEEQTQEQPQELTLAQVYLQALGILNKYHQKPSLIITGDAAPPADDIKQDELLMAGIHMAKILESLTLIVSEQSRIISAVTECADPKDPANTQFLGVVSTFGKVYGEEIQFALKMEEMVRLTALAQAGVDPSDQAAVQAFFQKNAADIVQRNQ